LREAQKERRRILVMVRDFLGEGNETTERECKSIFHDFRYYMDRVKPSLDLAFKTKVLSCLRNISMNDTTYLVESLEAGKKIRGCLTCMIAETLGGPIQAVIPRAVGVELIHMATLIHDDYVDQHMTRRNRSAPWTLEGARKAVLIGDMFVATTLRTMNDLGREEGRVISRAIALLSKGALYEPLDPSALAREIESNRFRNNLYERIIYLKTGVLFGTACQLGAIAANTNGRLGTISFGYGVKIGEAYQIADDIIDIEQYLRTRSIHPEEMAALTPAFLYFVKEMRPFVLTLLKKNGHWHLSREMMEFFQVALERMREAVRLRLVSAASEIEEQFPKNEFLRLVKRAPWDLVRIFAES
jgi:geranylgeranyl pyrophosphate synthase